MWANARQPSPGACSADGACDNGGDAICCGVCCADGGICSPSSDLRVARPHVEAGSFWAGRLGLGCVVGERVGASVVRVAGAGVWRFVMFTRRRGRLFGVKGETVEL